MKVEEILKKLDEKIDNGLLTKKGIAYHLGMGYPTLMYRYKVGGWRYEEVEKMKELL